MYVAMNLCFLLFRCIKCLVLTNEFRTFKIEYLCTIDKRLVSILNEINTTKDFFYFHCFIKSNRLNDKKFNFILISFIKIPVLK